MCIPGRFASAGPVGAWDRKGHGELELRGAARALGHTGGRLEGSRTRETFTDVRLRYRSEISDSLALLGLSSQRALSPARHLVTATGRAPQQLQAGRCR